MTIALQILLIADLIEEYQDITISEYLEALKEIENVTLATINEQSKMNTDEQNSK